MFTHLDEKNQPTMVDVSDKAVTARFARAECIVELPPAVADHLRGEELYLKKGPVFQTAIIAGTMAVKRTHELIPFCHPLPIEGCTFQISIDAEFRVTVRAEVRTTGKTGVEMEALTGVNVAALTIYDMCKALSSDIVIRDTRLVTKTGGKRPFLGRPTYGLILTGGRSERMGMDKALLEYRGRPHALHLREMLSPYCTEVFLSARTGQWTGTALESAPTITDAVESRGPIAGIYSALVKYPEANWIVLAVDLAHLGRAAIDTLIENYDPDAIATVFANAEEGFPEPLCAIYTPGARAEFRAALEQDIRCPVKVLRNSRTRIVPPTVGVDLTNVNTHAEFREVRDAIG